MAAAADAADMEDDVFTLRKTTHQRPTSIHHWQLRDLVSPGATDDDIYIVHEQTAWAYDGGRCSHTAVANLGFQPNSLAARHGFLAAGGQHGELEVRELSGRSVLFRGRVGHTTVNNSLAIASPQSQQGAQLYVCCNDSAVRCFALPSMAPQATIRCPCPINYAALSPDGRQLVAVGDCEPTLLYTAAPAGWVLAASFTEAHDVGMCAAWSQHGSIFASVHQCGTLAVWDARSGACVSKLGLPSAARCVKFSPAPVDLLAVSEHEGRVCLLDCRKWATRQVLYLAADDGTTGVDSATAGAAAAAAAAVLRTPQDVSGICFSPSGRRLWVGLEDRCVAYDLDTLKRRTFGAAAVA